MNPETRQRPAEAGRSQVLGGTEQLKNTTESRQHTGTITGRWYTSTRPRGFEANLDMDVGADLLEIGARERDEIVAHAAEVL